MRILAKGTSMYPTLKEGQIYTLESFNKEKFSIGDIIVYCVDNLTICHRVIKIIHTRSGEVYIKTKGDNCAVADPYAITLDMVVGKINL